MPKVYFIEFSGTKHEVSVPEGTALMRAAVGHGVPGIDGDCGGQCACATCHVLVEPEWLEQTGTKTEMETSMLDFADSTQNISRLACQIALTQAFEGMTVRMPDGQH